VNSTVQVKLSGVCSEDEHPEGETAGCRDAVLQQLHCVVIWIGTPENISRNIFSRCTVFHNAKSEENIQEEENIQFSEAIGYSNFSWYFTVSYSSTLNY